MEDLKLIIAGNIGKLRREAGMTQMELAEELNYSDKAISKWERGESVPDVGTLKMIAERFSVTVDYLLRPDHPVETDIKREYTRRQKRNHLLITVMACVSVWLIAAIIYTSTDIALPDARKSLWLAFAYAVPLTMVVLLVFNSIWGNRRFNFTIISVLIWSTLSCIFLSSLVFFDYGFWMVFVIGIPAQIIVFLWSGLRYK
ncbi:MAG: helix-turn-helix transcriptional regulator [Ruminococcaceae bacterium]|nr:helix-turn-helix transcriptional regulator [Oscillospiraceae bacterium]